MNTRLRHIFAELGRAGHVHGIARDDGFIAELGLDYRTTSTI